MHFTLTVLGVASAKPDAQRNSSAQVLNVHGRLFLIDCGEGVSRSMCRLGLSPLKLDAVCLSHLHGDHVFGIFGLLSAMGMYRRSRALHIYAPAAFSRMLEWYMGMYDPGFDVVHHTLAMTGPQELFHTGLLRVSAFPLRHGVECYGFRFDGIPSPAAPEEARISPVSYAYCSDTEPFAELAQWVGGVHALYHEATYTQEYADKARLHHHSTAIEAARCAKAAGVGRLLIGHYSSRVRDRSVYEAEARSVFPQTFAVDDGDVCEIR